MLKPSFESPDEFWESCKAQLKQWDANTAWGERLKRLKGLSDASLQRMTRIRTGFSISGQTVPYPFKTNPPSDDEDNV